MKTLKEIKEDYAKHYGYEDWMDMLRGSGDWSHDKYLDDISKEHAIEVAKQTQKNCYESIGLENSDDIKKILSPKNIPEL